MKITGPWTYHTIECTIDYGPGAHEVSEEIGAAWMAAQPKEDSDGGSPAKARAPRAADKA